MSLLTDPMGRSDPDWDRGEPQPGPGASAPDTEARELVQRFEDRLAELGPLTPEPPRAVQPSDDLFVDLPVAFTPSAPAKDAPVKSNAVERAANPTRSSAHAPASAEGAAEDFSFDQAVDLLRASEKTAKAAAHGERAAVDGDDDLEAADRRRHAHAPQALDRSSAPLKTGAAASRREGRHARPQWHRVLGIAAVALAIGAGVGYFAAQAEHSGTERAAAPAAAGGLRLDYDLDRR